MDGKDSVYKSTERGKMKKLKEEEETKVFPVDPARPCTHPILYHEFNTIGDYYSGFPFMERRCKLCGALLRCYVASYDGFLKHRKQWIKDCIKENNRIKKEMSLLSKLETPKYNKYIHEETHHE